MGTVVSIRRNNILGYNNNNIQWTYELQRELISLSMAIGSFLYNYIGKVQMSPQ